MSAQHLWFLAVSVIVANAQFFGGPRGRPPPRQGFGGFPPPPQGQFGGFGNGFPPNGNGGGFQQGGNGGFGGGGVNGGFPQGGNGGFGGRGFNGGFPQGGNGGFGGGGMGPGGFGGGRNVDPNTVMQQYAEVKGDIVFAKNGSGQCVEKTRMASKLTEEQFYSLVTSQIQRSGGGYRLSCAQSFGGPGVSCQSLPQIGNCDSGNTATAGISILDEQSYPGYRLILSNGIPKHCYDYGQEHHNPNYPCEHYVALLLPKKVTVPRNPSRNDFKEQPMGPVGISVSGGFMYNHKSAEAQCNVAAITENPTLDTCDGHADPNCRYHYHKAPVCIRGWNDGSLMGYLHDGIPVYGACNLRFDSGRTVRLNSCWKKRSSASGCDASHYDFSAGGDCMLDMANGYYFTEGATAANGQRFAPDTYAYFFTPEYPFVMPYYLGQSQTLSSGFRRGPPEGLCNIDVSRF